ncbi:MAG TPA: tetratricopeptide repeat protein, partial [Verrucomicrobiae bacterium]|nr:tetratricopeptide repeat protein [Verrucomicrobiae bacterium]
MCNASRAARRGVAAAFLTVAALLAAAGPSAWGAVETPARGKFAAGNAAYERGAYLEAITIYQELEHEGVGSAALEYNLGNALFKAGRLGPAILAYERAARLDPKDADARANLEYLRTLTIDRIPEAA